ncbi:MAG: hypothetical protein ABFE07_19710 [Armatimonadia bacterium]
MAARSTSALLPEWGTVLGITLFDQLSGGNSWMFFDLVAGAAGVPA